MTASYPTLGFDPVASDSATGADVAAELRAATEKLAEVDAVLSGTGEEDWEGRTAEAFRSAMSEELRPRVRAAHQSFSEASRAFDGWVGELPRYRTRADALEQEAAAAATSVQTAMSYRSSIESPADDADQQAKDDHDDAVRDADLAVSAAHDALQGVLSRARALQAEVTERAGVVATAFDTAMQAAPTEPGWLERAGQWASGLVDWKALGDFISEKFDWFMENVAPILQKLAKIIGAVATIVSVVAFLVGFVFPPAFAVASVAGTVAKVSSFVDLGIQGLRVVHGERGAAQAFVVQGAATVVGMGVARAIGPVATEATSNIRAGAFVPQVSFAGIGTNGGGAVATASYAVNNDFFHSAMYWSITSAKDLVDSGTTLRDETR
ncbi:hypothetical protein [Curtobacterium sp. NPDC089689]|uniref:hypothetical protein n=1 Tax=Curtobacterium sp. NPDC089689 TaxID=3363968 RepID=UPI0037FE56EF